MEIEREIKPICEIRKLIGENGKTKTYIKAKKTSWIEKLVYLDGKPFSFIGRPYLLPIYNSDHPKKLLLCGRQVEKSSMLANEIIVNSVITPYYFTLYVSPSHSQSRQFSNSKLRPWIEDSPLLKKYFISTSTSAQVFERGFTNGSMCFIRSAFLTADRARGLSACFLALDELQDLLTSNIPVIQECLSHAKDPREIMSGTPKSLENPIEMYWQESSMCEWLVPCHRHTPTHWNYLDARNIGKTGLICNKCGQLIDAQQGRWVSFNNSREIMGYRISQLMVPWFGNQKKWQEIIWKMENLANGVFHNEVLGISYDSSNKPISRSDVIGVCNPLYPYRAKPDEWTKRVEIFAGVDWGEGTDGSDRNEKGKLKPASYTLLTLGTYIDPKHFHYFYYRRFTGKDAHPEVCLPEIIRIIKWFRCIAVGADWGHGWGVNSRLEAALSESRVMQFQHVGNQRQRKKYDELGHKVQLSRTEVMTDFIQDLKGGGIILPPWEDIKGLTDDWEHIYAEYNEQTRMMKYDHKLSEPNDGLHSAIYCREAADVYYNKTR